MSDKTQKLIRTRYGLVDFQQAMKSFWFIVDRVHEQEDVWRIWEILKEVYEVDHDTPIPTLHISLRRDE